MRSLVVQAGGKQILNSGLHVSESANPLCGCCRELTCEDTICGASRLPATLCVEIPDFGGRCSDMAGTWEVPRQSGSCGYGASSFAGIFPPGWGFGLQLVVFGGGGGVFWDGNANYIGAVQFRMTASLGNITLNCATDLAGPLDFYDTCSTDGTGSVSYPPCSGAPASAGAMAAPSNLEPDCQPEMRRGKPVIPKGKKKG